MDDRLRALLEKEEIIAALLRIARGTDRGDFALFASGYHEDAIDNHGLYDGPISGLLDVFAEANKTFLYTQHVLTNFWIELVDDRTARTETYFNAFHRRRDAEGALWDDWLKGRYLDRFEKRNGAWKVAARLCAWDLTLTEPAGTATWAETVGGEFVAGKRDKSDPAYAHFAVK